jgi:hypothetical protein
MHDNFCIYCPKQYDFYFKLQIEHFHCEHDCSREEGGQWQCDHPSNEDIAKQGPIHWDRATDGANSHNTANLNGIKLNYNN